MKTMLIIPPKKIFEVTPPLGLGYLAGSIRDISEVRIINCVKEGWDNNKLIEVLSEEEFDIIGFQVFSEDLVNVRDLIPKIRKMNKKAKILIGGSHASIDPLNTFKTIKPDYLFIGEAEESLRDFVSGVDVKEINGIVYKEGRKLITNPKKLNYDLDKYQIAWDLLEVGDYPTNPQGSYCKQSPIAPIIITRGCPFRCSYCCGSKITGHQIRSHSLEYVIKQIEILVEEYGIREIQIEDDNFTMNRNFVESFCDKLIEKDFGITWLCPNGIRLDTLDKELILLMKRSGLVRVYVGIESGSSRIRKHMRKSLPTGIIIEKINLLRSCKIDVVGFFIMGYPTETMEDINKTIDLALKLDLRRAAFNCFKPFPNTEIYNELVEKGELKDIDYNNYNFDTIIYSPKGISREDLAKIRKKAMFRFYLRPKQFYWFIKDFSNYRNMRSSIRRILLFLKR